MDATDEGEKRVGEGGIAESEGGVEVGEGGIEEDKGERMAKFLHCRDISRWRFARIRRHRDTASHFDR